MKIDAQTPQQCSFFPGTKKRKSLMSLKLIDRLSWNGYNCWLITEYAKLKNLVCAPATTFNKDPCNGNPMIKSDQTTIAHLWSKANKWAPLLKMAINISTWSIAPVCFLDLLWRCHHSWVLQRVRVSDLSCSHRHTSALYNLSHHWVISSNGPVSHRLPTGLI